MFYNNLALQDLTQIREDAKSAWLDLFNSKLLLTGGTGFIGKWFLESIIFVNEQLNANIYVSILTRNIDILKFQYPHFIKHKFFNFITGDVNNFPANKFSECTHIIHAATEASAELNEQNPKLMFETIVNGTQNILKFAVEKKITRMLFLSSGAIYGQQPVTMNFIDEKWLGSLDCSNPSSAYAEAKRAAETLCAIYAKQYHLEIGIARIFSLLGPYLPLKTHYAAGNFIDSALNKSTILINGNGQPIRSYLYPTDLIVWLLHIFLYAPSCMPFNVGSSDAISIKNLAIKIAKTINNVPCQIKNENGQLGNQGAYIPSVELIYQHFGLKQKITLDQAISRTYHWHQIQNK